MAERNTVVVIDGGGRGTALIDKYSQSPHVDNLIAIPGNDWIKRHTPKPVEVYPKLKTTSLPEIIMLCKEKKVDLVDVAQDNAVHAGLVDALEKEGIKVLGPTRAAGEIEWSKIFARKFGKHHHLPQPWFHDFYSEYEGKEFLFSQLFSRGKKQEWFVKADSLAAGKGALPARNTIQALRRVSEVQKYGSAYLIEKWLRGTDGKGGEEFSTFILSDGENFQLIGNAQDHKRVSDFDEGENTGGMGCSTPPLLLTLDIVNKVRTRIVDKTIKGLVSEGRPYKGILYLGGMVINEKGELNPYVIEFNARWGDPEAQVILPGLQNDLFEVGMAVVEGSVNNLQIQMDKKARVAITGASRGYPGNYDAVKNKRIHGLNEAMKVKGVKVYGAGVKVVDGEYWTSGGRLFYVVGEGNTVIDARERAYAALARISIEGNNLHFRTDIGWRDVSRLRRSQSNSPSLRVF